MAAADGAAAQVAGLEPARGLALLVHLGGVGDQRLQGHADERGADALGDDDPAEEQHVARDRDGAQAQVGDGAQQGADPVPALARQGQVDDRAPQELDGVGQDGGRHQRGDFTHRQAGVARERGVQPLCVAAAVHARGAQRRQRFGARVEHAAGPQFFVHVGKGQQQLGPVRHGLEEVGRDAEAVLQRVVEVAKNHRRAVLRNWADARHGYSSR